MAASVKASGEKHSARICIACGAPEVLSVFTLPSIPVHCNVLWPTREQALSASRGDMHLGFCRRCGHVMNISFDAAMMEYTPAYENSLHFSARFQTYAESLARRLVEDYNIRKRTVIDIGCGKGDFLALLCDIGGNTGIGFDPSYVPGPPDTDGTKNFRVHREFYPSRREPIPADLITCRHVLEHIQNPRGFVSEVRSAVQGTPDTVVFLEVPNVLYTLKDMGIWDLIYEHCSYFSPGSLSRLLRSSGFEVKKEEVLYDGQFLGIDTVPAGGANPPGPGRDTEELEQLVTEFGEKYRSKVAFWKAELDRMSSAGTSVALWGGGSKGVMFLNTLKPGDSVHCMVDINPRKQGMFVSGTGHPVVGPDSLRQISPGVVIVMNPVYLEEVRQELQRLGIQPELKVA